jgi:hypothetical protein
MMSLRTALIIVPAFVGLTACGAGNGGEHGYDGAIPTVLNGPMPDQTGSVVYGGQEVHANHGPITTYPIVGRSKVPAGMTPTGETGYAVANSARSNGTIVSGVAAACGYANSAAYSDGCDHYAGGAIASTPYR